MPEEERCVCCDLPIEFCENHKPKVLASPPSAPSNLFAQILNLPGKSMWFVASYPGRCSGCDDHFDGGDEIRADGDGGWEARCCDE